MKGNFLFSSESVTEGHPDKVCDKVSDAVLDAALAIDPESRVACETATTTDYVLVMGEITTNAQLDYEKIVRDTIKEIGYVHQNTGFNADTCKVDVKIHSQSPDISQGVTEGQGLFLEQGAGDQGLMFGFACNETPELMPLPISLAHKLTQKLTEVRKSGEISYLRPDGKSQVTVEYENNKPKRVTSVTIAAQHEDLPYDVIKKDILEKVVIPVCGNYVDSETKYYINATGKFIVGGPHGDAGLTGRKIIVDTYGGYGRHGGGAFSGKDPSKVDRSAAYYCRYVAKNVVAAGLADSCEVHVAYTIGVANPHNVTVHTFGTGKLSDKFLAHIVEKVFDFRPSAIIKNLDLKKPRYKNTAAYGHFGRNLFPWEQVDKVNELKKVAEELIQG